MCSSRCKSAYRYEEGVQPARVSCPEHREKCLVVRSEALRKLISRSRTLGARTPLCAFDRLAQSTPIAAEPLI